MSSFGSRPRRAATRSATVAPACDADGEATRADAGGATRARRDGAADVVDMPSAARPQRGVARSLMSRAVGLLSRRDHGRVELGRKLQRYLGPDETKDDIERVLDRLQEQNLLSDARYAAGLVRQRSVRYGDLRLVRDLRERGVGAAEADAAMAAVAGTETQRALDAWSRRFDALPTDAAERGRQGRYLQSRGFSMDVIVRVLTGKAEPER